MCQEPLVSTRKDHAVYEFSDWLIGAYMDNFAMPSGGKSIDLDPWLIRGGLPLEKARQALIQ
jgi:hypothetical protein